MATLKVGDKAPIFKGIDQNGNEVSLTDFHGRKLIIYFYPKDNTPGCSAQACNLNENYSEITKSGYEVIGISPDSTASHLKFIAKYDLHFTLIADEDKSIATLYGVFGEKKLYGKTFLGIKRTTFVINEKGIIEQIIEKVKTKDHFNQIFPTNQ